MSWTPGPLSESAVSNILKALGIDCALPGSLADDEEAEEAYEQAVQVHGTLGLRFQEMVQEYNDNAERVADHGRMEKDIADLRNSLDRFEAASARIRDRSRGASDHIEFGLEPTERDRSEEEIACWFDSEWSGGAEPAVMSFARLRALASALQEDRLAPVPLGRRRTSRTVVRFVSLAADQFEAITGKKATTSKANGDTNKNPRLTGSERQTDFLRFLDVLFEEAGIRKEKEETVRTALVARKNAGKLPV